MNTPSSVATAPPLIQAQGVTVRRDGQVVVNGVDLAIHPGEIVTIVGPNGAGKSSLLQALLGLIPLHGGQVARHPGLVIGYVPQKVHVDMVLPLQVTDFVALSRRPGADLTPEAVLHRVGCAFLARRPVSALSGGEMQRVLLARALMRRPNLLVLDEPAQGLDMSGQQEFHASLDSLRREMTLGVLLVSHDLHFVMAATDRVFCLNRHICCSGTPQTVRTDPGFLSLFGNDVASMGVYHHHHDHTHHHWHPDPTHPPTGEDAP